MLNYKTLIFEIEVILYNHPIGVDYDDDQEDVLTPNHLIFGHTLAVSNNDVNVDTILNKSNCEYIIIFYYYDIYSSYPHYMALRRT